METGTREVLKERIITLAEASDLHSPVGAIDAFEKWDWQERQAKFIVNSVRVYEFWGYEWWLPLWDYEMMEFWARIPLKLRVGQILYIEYVPQRFAQVASISNYTAILSANKPVVKRIVRSVRRTPLYGTARVFYRLLNKVRKYREYENHPLAWYGIVDRNVFEANIGRFQNINSFLVRDLVNPELGQDR